MKTKLKRIMSCILTFIFAISVMAVPSMEAHATTFKRFDYYMGQDLQYLIYNSGGSRYMSDYKLISVKSSNPNVVSTKIINSSDIYDNMSENGQNYAVCTAKKPGKATITYKYKVGGYTYTDKLKWEIVKYKNPFSSVKIGKQDYKKAFNQSKDITIPVSNEKQKLSIKLKKGYELSGISLSYRAKYWMNLYMGGKWEGIANNTKVDTKTIDVITVSVRDKKRGETETYEIYVE